MTDLDRFLAAMDGTWTVERETIDPGTGRLRVYYRSEVNPLIVWSHTPFDEDEAAPIGTIGRIGFQWDKRQHDCPPFEQAVEGDW